MLFSFRNPHFWHPPNFAKTLFWHTVALFVFLKMPKKHYKTGEKQWKKKNLDQFLTQILDQFLTLQHIYIYIYIYIHIYICICCRDRIPGQIFCVEGAHEFLAAEPSFFFQAIESRAQEHVRDFWRDGTKFYRTRVQILSLLLHLDKSISQKSQNPWNLYISSVLASKPPCAKTRRKTRKTRRNSAHQGFVWKGFFCTFGALESPLCRNLRKNPNFDFLQNRWLVSFLFPKLRPQTEQTTGANTFLIFAFCSIFAWPPFSFLGGGFSCATP